MGNFSNNAITDVGRMLLADVQAGAVFVPTRIVMGSGNMPGGATAQGMTDVLTPVISLTINKKKRTPDGKCVFGGVYTNEDITEPFYFRELALYAKAVTYNADGSVKSESAETLYSYGNAGATADFMPAYSTSTVVEKQMDLVVWVGNETQIDLTIESGLYVTQREFSSHAARHAIGGEDPITPASIGAVKTSGDTMTGDLVINKAYSTVKLRAPMGEAQLYKNADAVSDYGTTISDELANGAIDRFNLSASRPLAEKLRLVVNGGDSYNVLHTGNKDLIQPTDIGAAPAGHVTKVYQAHTDEDITNAMLDAYALTPDFSVGFFIITAVPQGLMLLGGVWHMIVYRRNVSYGVFEFVSYDARTTRKMTRSLYNGVLQPLAWENPPMAQGVEYRTTERFHDVAVYKMNDANGNILWRKETESSWRLLSSASYVTPATVE